MSQDGHRELKIGLHWGEGHMKTAIWMGRHRFYGAFPKELNGGAS